MIEQTDRRWKENPWRPLLSKIVLSADRSATFLLHQIRNDWSCQRRTSRSARPTVPVAVGLAEAETLERSVSRISAMRRPRATCQRIHPSGGCDDVKKPDGSAWSFAVR